MPAQKISLRVIVSSTETIVQANPEAPLQVVAQHALNQTHNQSRQLSEWELRDAQGASLDLSRTVESYGFTNDTLLYLQPRVGVNGTAL